MMFLKSPDSLTHTVFTNRLILYHIGELYSAACEGIVLKEEQERMWRDEAVANFNPFKEDGKYIPFVVPFQTPSIRLPPEYVNFVKFSQSTRNISLNFVHWLLSAEKPETFVKYKLALRV
jgi:hypothetical protein